MPNKLLIVCFLSISVLGTALAQEEVDNQLWGDFTSNYTFKSGIALINEFNLHTDIDTEYRWREIDLSGYLSYNLFSTHDVYGGLQTSFQTQVTDTTAFNTIEIRPWIGIRFHFTPNSKFMLRLYVRLEYRYFLYLNSTPNDQGIRLRARPEIIYSINRANFYQDKLWFATLDFEYFLNLTDPPDERYIRNIVTRGGLGYRFNRTWQLKLLYIFQKSRNASEDSFNKTSSIINVNVNYHFPIKSSK